MEEETGIRLERALFAGVTNDVMPEDGKHYVDIIMIGVCKATDEAQNMEPSKCGALNVSGSRFRHGFMFYHGRGSEHGAVKVPLRCVPALKSQFQPQTRWSTVLPFTIFQALNPRKFSFAGGWFWAHWDSIPEGRFASLANLNASPFILPSPGEVTGGRFPSQVLRPKPLHSKPYNRPSQATQRSIQAP